MTGWIDLTHPVHEAMPVWEESERASIATRCEIDGNCPVRVSWIALGAHTGTHVDAPSHFLADGAMVEDLSLEDLIGPAWIADTGTSKVVDAALLDSLGIPDHAARILFRTSNTSRGLMLRREFDRTYVGLDLSGAEWLARRKVRLVGFDYLSVQAFEASDETHRTLLRTGTVLLESLDLSRAGTGWHEIVCLPFLGKDLDGSPARVVARKIAPPEG